MTPVTPDQCQHRIRLTLLGQQVLLAVNSIRVAEILAETFSSRFFAPLPTEPTASFCCTTECDPPWNIAMNLSYVTYVGRASTERPYTFDLFQWTEEGILPAGSFSYENSNDLISQPTLHEIVAAYFQRRVLDAMLKKNRSFRFVHAGSLSCNGSGALLLARSKGGKSTLVLASVLGGMQFLSDDHSTIDLEKGVIHPFPRTLRLRQGTCDMIPEFMSYCSGTEVDPVGETRYHVVPENIRKDALGSSVKLTHVLHMIGFSKQPRISATNPADMAVRCAGADFFPAPVKSLDLLWKWGDLMKNIRCSSLEVGSPMETAEAIKAHLKETL